MATIKAIEQQSVHQIQSGQVIVDLTSVVKELVENSLDAGATSIDVRFKSQGIEYVEIQDNGNGIGPDDFSSVALKHYTSKVRNFEDIDSLQTFGFRGEALSSLSALSNLSIRTARAEDGAVGSRLEFETSGKLKSTSVTAAQKGTTVVVENIFHNLPVRKKALEKNIQREYNKALRFLESCACISINIKFTVSNQPLKGVRKTAFSTKGNPTIRENVLNVFGAKTVAALIPLDLSLTSQSSSISATPEANDLGITPAHALSKVHVEGFVSRPNWGEGRQAQDRQMLFVNQRPCLLPQVTKSFNEVYKSYNHHQHPFIIANFKMDTDAYDVNISPDKRTIMLHDHTAILEQLKFALIQLFDNVAHTVPQAQLQPQKLPSFRPVSVQKINADRVTAATLAVDPSDDEDDDTDNDETAEAPVQHQLIHDADTRESLSNMIGDWAGRGSTMRKQAPATIVERIVPSEPDVQDLSEELSLPFTAATSDDGPRVFGDRSEQLRNGPISLQNANQPQSSGYAFGTSLRDIISQSTLRPMPQRSENNGSQRTAAASTRSLASQSRQRSIQVALAPQEFQMSSTFNNATKVDRGPIEDAFAKIRPRRESPEIAGSTMGDQHLKTVVGHPNKKRRIYQPILHDSAIDLSSSPLTNRSLHEYAAPGSALASQHNMRETQDSDHEEDLFCEHSDSAEDLEDNVRSSELMPMGREPLTATNQREESILFDNNEDANMQADSSMEDDTQTAELQKKRQEEETVSQLIHDAEQTVLPSGSAVRRSLMREITIDQEPMHGYNGILRISTDSVIQSAKAASQYTFITQDHNSTSTEPVDQSLDAESKLSLTVSKSDFEIMHIVGQFNLGFILAIRPSKNDDQTQDELFIIDQHAADEKYNFERFRNALVLQSQRLVQPKVLELSAVEQEVILNHVEALKANGFNIEMVEAGDDEASIRTIQLTSLPMSANRTFTISDLEELLHLLSELPSGSSEIPRPRKVQQMLAMRACRSSIMVGKTLTDKQMVKVVRNMGEMEKPWNCPHGRPTMRHLSSLGSWNSWREGQTVGGDVVGGSDFARAQTWQTDWRKWVDQHS